MHALNVRPRTRTSSGRFPDRIDESPADTEGLALLVWKTLEGRLKDGQQIENGDTFTALGPRSDEDIAHFELTWKDTGRDIYRFTVW